MIADHPAEVADRIQVGHWEGDCIMGAGNRSAIGTLVERRTRYLILIHVPTAEAMREGLIAALEQLPAQLRRTLTWDQGKGLAMHQQISKQTGTRVFFCDAHAPWQRGSNENMNGLLRDYFPKSTDLRQVASAELTRVAHEINKRPRKTLAWPGPRICSPARPWWRAPNLRSSPEDGGRIAVDLREQFIDARGGRHAVVLVELQIAVAPIQRPQPRGFRIAQSSDHSRVAFE
jgi:hypothetical protein